VRKLIAFDDDTFDKLKQLGRDRMATFQELADEAFADLLKKHGIPIDLKDALRTSASLSEPKGKRTEKPHSPLKSKSLFFFCRAGWRRTAQTRNPSRCKP